MAGLPQTSSEYNGFAQYLLNLAPVKCLFTGLRKDQSPSIRRYQSLVGRLSIVVQYIRPR